MKHERMADSTNRFTEARPVVSITDEAVIILETKINFLLAKLLRKFTENVKFSQNSLNSSSQSKEFVENAFEEAVAMIFKSLKSTELISFCLYIKVQNLNSK